MDVRSLVGAASPLGRAGFLGRRFLAGIARPAGGGWAARAFDVDVQGGGLKRNPGEWLRELIVDRVAQVRLHGMLGLGWMLGAGFTLWVTRGPEPVPAWVVWAVPLAGAAFPGVALFRAKRGWRLADMRKGARAEARVGQAIERALTAERCAVAHHVEGVARIGDIDHLVATPRGLWVIETKHGRVPQREFPETLRRIAVNVEAVRDWAPGQRVTGCLVFANEPERSPRSTYRHGPEAIRCFATPEALIRELREEACAEGGCSRIALKVGLLAQLEDG